MTGIVSFTFSGWGFEPIIATADDQMRRLEVVGNVAIVLAVWIAVPTAQRIERECAQEEADERARRDADEIDDVDASDVDASDVTPA